MNWYKKAIDEFIDPLMNEVPEVPQEVVPEPPQEGVPQIGPGGLGEGGPQIIMTDVAEWKPTRGRNKGTVYYYLQMTNVPAGPLDSYMVGLGYKFNKKFGAWSKQASPSNVLSFEAEFTEIEAKYGIPVSRDAITKLQSIFGFTGETTTEIGGEDAGEDIKKIKFMDVEDKEKMAIAKDVVRKKLEELVSNIDTPETQAFMDQLTNLNNKFYKYSMLNSMMIAWQNKGVDPITGEVIPRSGTVASLGAWEDKFGRKVKDDAIGDGMDIFVPIGGGKKEIKPFAMIGLLKGIGAFSGMNSREHSLEGESIAKFLGFMKSRIAKSKKAYKKGFSIWKTNYDYMLNVIRDNKETIRTVGQLYDYFKGKLDTNTSDTYNPPLRFKIGPVYDMDQTEVIPGQEEKDPKAEMERVESMWLGVNNTPTEQTLSLRDLAIKAAANGKVWKGKNIDVGTGKATGRSGGWSSGREVQLSNKIAGERELFTLMHELAHSVLHFGIDRPQMSSVQKEVDAEGTAYVVMGHYGFSDNERAYNYIANWTKKEKNSKDFVMNRFEPILAAANAIIAGIEQQKMEDYSGKGGGDVVASSWYNRLKYGM